MKTRQIWMAVGVFAFLAGCDLIARATAEKVMVGTVMATPSVTFSPSAVAGSSVDAGTVTAPGQTVAYVFFGDRNGDAAPDGITGANITVGPSDGTAQQLDDSGGGSYAKTSVGNSGFMYTAGKSYEFEATHSGTTFTGTVENSPNVEQIAAFHPPQGFVQHAVNQAFTFQRPALAAGAERTLGFVTVFPVNDQGQSSGSATYTNVPSKPLEFLQLVAAPGPWRTDSVQIPATAFPTAGTTYFVLFQSVKLGFAKTNNLFVGSAFLAGSGDVGVLRTP